MSDHIVSPKIYVAVFAALMVLTLITVGVARLDLEPPGGPPPSTR